MSESGNKRERECVCVCVCVCVWLCNSLVAVVVSVIPRGDNTITTASQFIALNDPQKQMFLVSLHCKQHHFIFYYNR
jgi:hypothetical protein